jgi:4'-phosphopantetheinyl transferase
MQWLASGEEQIPPGREWLTDAECARAASMRFTKRRTEYLLRRLAGKHAVAATVGLPTDPAGLRRVGVLNRPTGAPFVQVDGRDLGLDVSLTDRAGSAVCLVGPDLGAVGCDLEIVEPRSDGFIRDFLTASEQDVVFSMPDVDSRDAAANLIWSAKESALKVLRTGLRADTRTVEVVIEGLEGLTADHARAGSSRWRPLTVRTVNGPFPGWWRRDGVFLLTVAASAGLGDPPEVLPGSADLRAAEPIHSWLQSPQSDWS